MIIELRTDDRARATREAALERIKAAARVGGDIVYLQAYACPMWLAKELRARGFRVDLGHSQSIVTWRRGSKWGILEKGRA